MRTRIIIIIYITFFVQHLSAQSCSDLPGTWINELGSALIIDSISTEGKIFGKYASSTGVDGKIFPLDGWINFSKENPDEINISFSVKWIGYGSITSWTGYCLNSEKGSEINTMWHLVRSGKEFDWERIISNSSTFRPVKNH